jgi:hypothetical protein
MRPLLSIDLLAPSKEKKNTLLFCYKTKAPTPEFQRYTKDMYDQNWK